jgi:phage tail-like protein
MVVRSEQVAIAARFVFEVDGVEIGVFREVEGLRADIDVVTIEEGGQNEFAHVLPGRLRWPHIVLKRGITSEDNLFAWMRRASGDGFAKGGNRFARSTGAITVLNDQDRRMRSWELVGAFPVRWQGPTLAASRVETADEELEIAHHGFHTRT